MQIYVITNRVNGKKYVGQTVQLLKKRLQAHKDNAATRSRRDRHVSILGNAILKYGIGSFEIAMLQTCQSYEEMNAAEIEWIERLNTITPNGYNIRQGGGNAPIAESTKQKLRDRIVSEETRRKISLANTGRKANEKQRAALQKKRDLQATPEARAALSQKMAGVGNYNAVLSEEQVSQIRQRYAAGGISQQALADEYGVKQITISVIVRCKCWRHLPCYDKAA